jgi:hypothetical protein
MKPAIGYLLFALLVACNQRSHLFEQVRSSHSGIKFNNHIVESDSINPIDVTNIYNGGGVGVGDFNRDGLQDIYFAGSQVSNQLYLNQGNFRFKNVTEASKVTGDGRWCRGVAVVDINNDSLPDIYVCATIYSDPQKRKNLLYVNQGADNEGTPVFKEMSAEYGLDDDSYSTMAAFFDYDNDGDLDVYITVNDITIDYNPSQYRKKVTDGSFPSTGRLYRNDWSDSLKHAFFTNVSEEAGVTIEGYGHSATIADFNRDGWKDIFVANDFLSNDLLYINNKNGTFTDRAASYFKHTSANGMGADVVDINNDGLADVVELDMDPEDNYRKKLLMSGYNYQNYLNNDQYGYQYQYVRNTLQLNMGPVAGVADSADRPIYGDVSYFSGISSTDWSWAPLVQDFDNDQLRDIIITNGFPKDLTDHDFIAFREKSFMTTTKAEVLAKVPQVKIGNYAYRNNGNVTFTDVSKDWGIDARSFSNGAAYVDLDNDGDLDVVINNINDEAFVYRNTVNNRSSRQHYLDIRLAGPKDNIDGLGTWIEICAGKNKLTYEHSPYRGYLSSMSPVIHFGLGETTLLDSVVVVWPGGEKQVLTDIAANQTINVRHSNASGSFTWQHKERSVPLFKEVRDSALSNLPYAQKNFIDFNVQRLLPHKFSEYSPPLCSGDVNGDGLDDLIYGGCLAFPARVILQEKNGSFSSKSIIQESIEAPWKDIGLCLFDADGDGDLDLYRARGGYEGTGIAYLDRFYLNDGAGNFRAVLDALPANFSSKSCVRAADYDNDGDLDLFIGGRVDPWNFPMPVSCFIYRNDSKDGRVLFTDVTKTVAPSLIKIGMVCDGNWSDFDNDGWPDLVIAGEWMPVRFLHNDHGTLVDNTGNSGINELLGWWNSIVPGDFDNDGDIDYVVGNLGLNSFYRATKEYPLEVYAKDFFNRGAVQCIMTQYLKDTVGGAWKQFTSNTRDDIIEQFPFLKKRFLTYKDFARTPFSNIFTTEEMEGALRLRANFLSHSFIRNLGGGKFELQPLPGMSQYSALNGMIADDFNDDGNLDLCISTNDFSTEPSSGRFDALNGLVMIGDGKGNFTPLSIEQSGFFVPGNGKGLVRLRNANNKSLLVASQYNGPLKIFACDKTQFFPKLNRGDRSALLHLANGNIQKRELNNSSSFLSQSSKNLGINKATSSVDIFDAKGNKRTINVPH